MPAMKVPNMTIGTKIDDGLSTSTPARGTFVAVGPGLGPWGTVPFGVTRPVLDLS